MRIHPDKTVTLGADEAKLALSIILEWEDANGARTSIMSDGLRAGLALALFGDNGRLVTSYDSTQLRHEAYAEWRRG